MVSPLKLSVALLIRFLVVPWHVLSCPVLSCHAICCSLTGFLLSLASHVRTRASSALRPLPFLSY